MQGLTPGNLTMMEKGEGHATGSTWILANRVHTCTAEAVILVAALVTCRTKAGAPSDQGICWADPLDLDAQRSFADPVSHT